MTPNAPDCPWLRTQEPGERKEKSSKRARVAWLKANVRVGDLAGSRGHIWTIVELAPEGSCLSRFDGATLIRDEKPRPWTSIGCVYRAIEEPKP